jgi:hypothetical protein
MGRPLLKRLSIPASTSIQVGRISFFVKLRGEVLPAPLRSVFLLASAQLTAPENHSARIALCLNTRRRTESFAFFTFTFRVRELIWE